MKVVHETRKFITIRMSKKELDLIDTALFEFISALYETSTWEDVIAVRDKVLKVIRGFKK